FSFGRGSNHWHQPQPPSVSYNDTGNTCNTYTTQPPTLVSENKMLRMAIRLALLIELICLLAVQPFCFLQPRHCLTLLPTPTAHSITCKGLSASGSDEQNVKPFVNENSFDLIKGNQVIRASDGERLDITYLWTGRTNEKIILVFLRHFGCPFSWEFAGELAR
ncbi:unnamed protein product, partial [Heterosigma akashiwo]